MRKLNLIIMLTLTISGWNFAAAQDVGQIYKTVSDWYCLSTYRHHTWQNLTVNKTKLSSNEVLDISTKVIRGELAWEVFVELAKKSQHSGANSERVCDIDFAKQYAVEAAHGRFDTNVYMLAFDHDCSRFNDAGPSLQLSAKIAVLSASKEINPNIFFPVWRQKCDLNAALTLSAIPK
jgi:hypothetical protein